MFNIELGIQSATHSSQSGRLSLKPRRFSMCLQPSLPFVVVTNCSTQALFREGCSRACLTCRCYWVPAQVRSRQLESHAETALTAENFVCCLIYNTRMILLHFNSMCRPLCELRRGRQGYRVNYEQVKCDSWPLRTKKQSRVSIVNTNYIVAQIGAKLGDTMLTYTQMLWKRIAMFHFTSS